MVSKEKPSREQALRVARYLGCSGAHQDDEGNWMPCSSHETLIRISTEAETPSYKPLEKAFRSLGGGIGRRHIRRNVPFDRFARDGEGDGIVQEGTQWERPATPISLAEILKRVQDPDGGFTISTSKMDDVKSGWAIARKGEGIKVDASVVFDKDGNVTEEGINYLEAFLEFHRDKFSSKPTSRSRIALGAWHNPKDGQIYFDVTDVFAKDSMDLKQALKKGKDEDQISIADLDELHAALAEDNWDNHVVFHDTGGSGRVHLPDEKFKPFLDDVRRLEESLSINEKSARDSVERRRLAGKKRRRYINKDWENLEERGVFGIDTLPSGGLVSGLQKSLTQWFKEEWVDISRPKKGGGFEPCGRNDADKGKYPKCVPAARASQMSDEEIRSAITRKRRAESTQTRVDKKPIYVPTKKKDDESSLEKKSAIPTDPELYARVKAEAKKKFDVYPSVYANAWLVREYKKRGGKYRSEKSDYGDYEDFVEDLTELQLSEFMDWVDRREEKASTSTIIIGRARPRIGDPDVFTDPNSARLRGRQLGCIGIARRETPDGEVVWTPCTNVSDQRRFEGRSPLGRRDEMRRFADKLREVGGPALKRRRMRKYKG